ncbi:hypothetical protein CJJ19_04825 [Candidatus Williamhamiltonella defendens]|nr:hypothetical protein CJJ19_04825 [Candidatus Hamiltonella defensa]
MTGEHRERGESGGAGTLRRPHAKRRGHGRPAFSGGSSRAPAVSHRHRGDSHSRDFYGIILSIGPVVALRTTGAVFSGFPRFFIPVHLSGFGQPVFAALFYAGLWCDRSCLAFSAVPGERIPRPGHRVKSLWCAMGTTNPFVRADKG